MKTYFSQIVIALFLVAFFASCDTNKDENSTNSFQSVKDNALSENIYNDVFEQVNSASTSSQDELNGGTKAVLSGCATITLTPFDTITWPKTLTIDFGTSNCLGTDGNYRRGIIQAVLTDWYREPGSVRTVTFLDYYVNDNKVDGMKTIENNGYNTNSNLNYDITVTNGIITKPDSSQIFWSASRNREWINGDSTWVLIDDEYLISGYTDGINSLGDTFGVTINVPLHFKVGCPWMMAGEITLENQNLPDRVVDFGNGTCDNQATVTVNGNTFNITLN